MWASIQWRHDSSKKSKILKDGGEQKTANQRFMCLKCVSSVSLHNLFFSSDFCSHFMSSVSKYV